MLNHDSIVFSHVLSRIYHFIHEYITLFMYLPCLIMIIMNIWKFNHDSIILIMNI